MLPNISSFFRRQINATAILVQMFKNSRRANKPKRLRTEINPREEESSFTDITIPLSLPLLPPQILSDDLVPSSSSFNLESQSEDECSDEILKMPHSSNKSCNANELELDSMWNEVYDTLIAQTEDRELRDWEMTMTQEDESDFEEFNEEITFTFMGRE